MVDCKFRVLAVASHPVQYHAPIFRRLASSQQLSLQVAYCSLKGAEPNLDPDFGVIVEWDVPLLEGYDWVYVPNRGAGSNSFFGLHNPALWKLIRQGGFAAILCFVGYVRFSFWIAYLAARTSNTAFLFGTDATNLSPRDGRSWKRLAKQVLWPRLFRLADQILAPSSAGVALMHSLGIPDERISLTPFVVDNDWWTKRAATIDRNAVRTSWGVSESQAVVLFCAKLQPWKRPLDLLHAFARAAVPDSILLFAGDGPLRQQLETEAYDLGIGARVRFLGFLNQSQLPAVYTSADLFVLPSDYDPCPAVVCEAMLCGCPVVLSDDIRGRFDLVQRGITGDVFSTGNVTDLVGVLTTLLSDRARLAQMRDNARRRMVTWSPHENVGATLAAIERAVSRIRSRPPA